MSESVLVRAPCRLHFGMFSFGRSDAPQFGGVGVMIEPPLVEVSFEPADCFSVRGDHAARVRQFSEMAAGHWQLPELPRCQIVVRSPGEHLGLGVGTQLGLATAAGLRRFMRLPDLPIESLAASVGRGRRSAIGTYGFSSGGLIVDAGKGPNDLLGRLDRRLAIPETWRFVLVRPTNSPGLAGDLEADAFAKLSAVPDDVTSKLWRITSEEMLPAVAASKCAEFGEAVYRFGRLAGECFTAAQGGTFASPRIAEIVAAIRRFGVAGVGQSSWGPTVFAIVADQAEAERLVAWLRDQRVGEDCAVNIARPNNSGAAIVI